MSRLEITCIKKSSSTEYHERITSVGNTSGNWTKLLSVAIAEIESRTNEFYVTRGGSTANVIVATRLGKKYLKTVNDGESPDNLLSLPDCK